MSNIKQIYKSITKYPISSFLNILSLTIAFTGIIILLLYVFNEYSFDKHNKNYDNIYQLQIGKEDGTLPAIMVPFFKKNVPGISAITPILFINDKISAQESEDKTGLFEIPGIYAENDIFDIFTYDFIFGEKNNALIEDKTIVLTKTLSEKLFGKTNPIGKKVNMKNEIFTCTGVINDIPETSSIKADCIISFATLRQNDNSFGNDWTMWSFRIFIKINNNENYNNVITGLNSIDEVNKVLSGVIYITDKEQSLESTNNSFGLQPLSELHFSGSQQFICVNSTVLKVLILLAIILAIMGVVNFINLLTSQALQRAKVFSVKRILGATRTNVFIQIVIESIVISLFALAIAFLIHSLIFPFLENILRINGLDFKGRNYLYLYFVGMAVIYGVIASLYPARYITSVNISQSAKGAFQFSGQGKLIRNILFVLQFTFTIVLIIGSMAVEKQINFWHNFDTGINTENIIYINTSENIRKHKNAFSSELIKNKNILDYTYSQNTPGSVGMSWGRTVDGQNIFMSVWPVDERFIDFFDIKILEGRKFSDNIEADRNKFIVNQTSVKNFNWEKPLEKKIPGFDFESEVIGVAKDINFSSLKGKIYPMQFWLTDEYPDILMLKLSGGNITNLISHIEDTWSKFEPDGGFNYKFLDESLNEQYQKEENIAHFIEFVAIWCILLSITGLLGLAIFASRQRTKEIGIRKVNGATMSETMLMLNKDFSKWIIIAFIIAIPISYYAISKWLENFAYKTVLSWWVFALAGILALTVALLTVSWQTYRVASKNPVESLRYE